MKHWQTKQGTLIFQVLSGRSNSFLVSTENINILIDTGKTTEYEKLSNNLDLIIPDTQKLDYLILTHTHFDHCQNAKDIKQYTKCKIIVHPNEEEYITMGYTPLPEGTMLFTRLLQSIGTRLGKRRFRYHPFSSDISIHDNFRFESQRSDISIIYTKGHSAGSISVIIDNEIAIVGDTLFGIFKNSVFPPYADNVSSLLKSWGKLLNTNCYTFLPGHGREIHRGLLQNEYKRLNSKNHLN